MKDLLEYLSFIKNNQDHIHLLIGNELDSQPNPDNNRIVKHVKITYIESEE